MPRSKVNVKPSTKGKQELEGAKKNIASQKISRKSAPVVTGVKPKQKRRSRPGQAALRQIKKYQKSTLLLLPKAMVFRRIRAIAQDARLNYEDNNELDRKNSGRTLRFSSDALLAIHEALESSVCSLFEDSYLCTMHAKRMTLFDKDIALARRIRGDKF